MVGGIFYEHGHRMVAAAVGLLTLILALWTAHAETRAWVRRLAWLCLGVVITQGLLGGLTVLLLLPKPISIAHACLAQTFFCLLLLLAYVTSREWFAAGVRAPDRLGIRQAALTASLAVYVQLLLGALMRHLGAGLAIPDFPLVFGGLVPPAWSAGIAAHYAHRLGAVAVLASFVPLVLRCRRSGDARLARHALVLAGLLLAQIALGAATVLSGKAVLPTTTHVAAGAAVLGGAWLLALRARRLLQPESDPLATPAARRAAAAA
jgi:cytochrome c oxidase assembly protein subunit 15